MSTATAPATGFAPALRRLYFVRAAFALVWAGVLVATASALGPLGVTLLVLYPVFDAVAAIADARSARAGRPVAGLIVNVAVSLLAGAGLAVAVGSGIPAVLRVWGVWAVLSGVVQLVVGVLRRGVGGQWPMIASGAISVLAGSSFVLQAAKDGATLSGLAGYATLGGVFFLVSALRIGRARKTAASR